jgi:hypothetical protein
MKKNLPLLLFVLSALTAIAQAGGPQILEPDPEPLSTGSMVYVLAGEPYRVLIDGRLIGNAPRLVADLPGGSHRLSVESDSLVYRRILNVDPSRSVLTRVAPAMRPYSGTLVVETHGVAAEVAVDGIRLGVSPLRIERIASGAYTLTVDAAGHARVDRSVVVPRDGIATVDVQLEPGHRLVLEPSPSPDARVEVSDAGSQNTRAFRFADLPLLPAGVQTFRVTAEGLEPFEFSVDPAQTAAEPVGFSPKRLEGSIRFTGLPKRGIMTVNGKKVDAASPTGLLMVAPGVASVGVEAPGFSPSMQITFVGAGQTVDLKIESLRDVGAVTKVAGWSTLASGVALSAGGILLNLDSIAVGATSTYSNYVAWKYSTLAAAGVGLGAVAAAIILLLAK